MNASRFRPDLYFRLAVVKIPIPPLRERPEDLPVVVEQLLASLTKSAQLAAPLKTPEFIDSLRHSAWPGNVRELRNHLERCLVFQDALPLADAPSPAKRSAVDASLSYAEARRRALDDFERDYLEALLRLHQGKVAKAAGAAEIGRVSLYRLMRRHNLKP